MVAVPLPLQLGFIKLMDLVTIHIALFMFQFHQKLLPKAFDNFLSLILSKHGYSKTMRTTITRTIKLNLLMGKVLGWHQSQLIILIRSELITVNLIYTACI